jgi:hypothetical protein
MIPLKKVSVIHTLLFIAFVSITYIPNSYFGIFSEQAIAGLFSFSGAIISLLFLLHRSFSTVEKILWILISLTPFLTLIYWTQL